MSQRSNSVPLAVPTLTAIALRVPSSMGRREPRLSTVIGDERKAHELTMRYGTDNVGRVATYVLDEIREERSFWRGTLVGQAATLESLAVLMVESAKATGDEQRIIEASASARVNYVNASALRREAGKGVGVDVPPFNAYPDLDLEDKEQLRSAYGQALARGGEYQQGTLKLYVGAEEIVRPVYPNDLSFDAKVYLWSLCFGFAAANTDPQ